MPILDLDAVNSLARKSEPDILSDAMRAVRLSGAIFWDNEAHGVWTATTPTVKEIQQFVMPGFEHVISFHIVTAGSCWAELADDPSSAVQLTAGDAIVFPRGDEHNLGSSPGMVANPNPAEWDLAGRVLPVPSLINGEARDGEPCRFVCGFLGCDARPFNPMIDSLPRMFRARPSAKTRTILSTLLSAALTETEGSSAGRESVLATLAEVMFVEVIRDRLDGIHDEAYGWLPALKDRHIGAALRLIHARPAEPWTIEALAREAGLSRSRFAARFATHLGISPIQYLARWRMQLAVRILEEGKVSLAQAAADVGYEFEAAFQRAFKKHVGQSPGAWRKRRVGRAGAELAVN